jgi:phosphatidate phosphatase APP1
MPSDFFKKKAAELAGAAKGAAKGALDGVESAVSHVAGAVENVVEGVFRRDKEVIVYPTYGYRKEGDGGPWVVRLRVWVSKARKLPVPDAAVAAFTSEMGTLNEDEIARLRERIASFVADDDSREVVRVTFDEDPEGRTYDLPGVTDANGLLMTELELPDASARAILAAQGSANGWLDFTAAVDKFEGKGRARLVEPEGISVISDIDDTIKITEVPAGKRIILRNTFLGDYKPTKHMPELYREFGDGVMFHYVSGSPWQLYKLLGEFVKGSFPEGAFHMKNVRKNLFDPESWHDSFEFAKGSEATLGQKVEQIGRILKSFPRRKFILFGDSGEKDPEVFRKIKREFGEQVSKIYIRDVVGERIKTRPHRLDEGDDARADDVHIDVIEADLIEHGVSHL